jgi:hypothetical protein
MVVNLAVDLFAIALTAWFWPHCAKPVLIYYRATPAAQWIVLGVSALQIAAYGFFAGAEFVPIAFQTRLWILGTTGGLWLLVVGAGYLQNYSLLRRVTGKREPPSPN